MQREAGPPDEDLVDAVMTASRALLAVTARSLAAVDDDVTLPQYRALVVLAQSGPRRPADLAAALAVTPSTGTRMCDRLVSRGLVRRERAEGDDRRAVAVSLSGSGDELVRDVTARRRAELSRLLGALPEARRRDVADALRAFAVAAGEVSEGDWVSASVTR